MINKLLQSPDYRIKVEHVLHDIDASRMFYGFDDIKRWCLYQLGISCCIIFLISSTLFLIKPCNKFESDQFIWLYCL